MAADGALRPHYAKFFGSLEQIGAAELERRWENSRRLVQEQGITYNVYGDARGMERPWVAGSGAASSSRRTNGVRSKPASSSAPTLINRILADCYGPQDLIRTALACRPRWFSASRIFCAPATASSRGRENSCIFYAADLARSPDGRWWVISDRTQIPTGAGYALANRLVTSRILPEPFRDNAGSPARRIFPRGAKNARATRAARSRTIRASSCSRRDRTTKPISSRRISRATSATARRGPGFDRARRPRFPQNARRPRSAWT